MDNEFNRVVVGICIIVILCCLFIAMKYDKEVEKRAINKTIPLQLPVKESKMPHSFESAHKRTE